MKRTHVESDLLYQYLLLQFTHL